MGEGDLGSTPPAFGADGSSSSSSSGGGMPLKQCQDIIQKSFENPMVKFLVKNLRKSGCDIGSNFIRAVNCKQINVGTYYRGRGIELCSNHLYNEDDVHQIMIHMLIRAYDECRAANFDWMNCAHHACSEIRANHLSGHCHFKRQLLYRQLKIKGQGQECVKERTMQSLTANPCCSKIGAKDAMEAVWDTCYNDTAPFDRAP